MTDKSYLQFVQRLKEQILQSRYQAARLVNRELLLLYHQVGKAIGQKARAAKWGAKVLEKIAADLQKELPGLRGFSAQNIKKMRVFYDAYPSIGSSLPNQLTEQAGKNKIGSLATNQFAVQQIELLFFQLSFTHHFLLR